MRKSIIGKSLAAVGSILRKRWSSPFYIDIIGIIAVSATLVMQAVTWDRFDKFSGLFEGLGIEVIGAWISIRVIERIISNRAERIQARVEISRRLIELARLADDQVNVKNAAAVQAFKNALESLLEHPRGCLSKIENDAIYRMTYLYREMHHDVHILMESRPDPSKLAAFFSSVDLKKNSQGKRRNLVDYLEARRFLDRIVQEWLRKSDNPVKTNAFASFSYRHLEKAQEFAGIESQRVAEVVKLTGDELKELKTHARSVYLYTEYVGQRLHYSELARNWMNAIVDSLSAEKGQKEIVPREQDFLKWDFT
ncbi:MAG TPA: hypothetical protein VGO55_11740 [Allosphingosinicella sp.]|jgi:hypothetical protein|nr:hypothetical protein [Allosphingosinicella sp.]